MARPRYRTRSRIPMSPAGAGIATLLLLAAPAPGFGVNGQESGAAAAQERSSRPAPEIVATVDGDPVIQLLPRDGIVPIDDPVMVPAVEGDAFMKDEEWVLGVFDGKQARAYSTWHLDRHEVVNDRLSETPIAATW